MIIICFNGVLRMLGNYFKDIELVWGRGGSLNLGLGDSEIYIFFI